MPRKFLPVDTHVIEISKLERLIKQIPRVMTYSKSNNMNPYLPIHPISYRKKWQYDDEAYNFIFDFLYSFRLFSDDKELNVLVSSVRNEITKCYNENELVKIVYDISPDSTKRRMQTSEIEENLRKKFSRWKDLKIKNKKEIPDEMER